MCSRSATPAPCWPRCCCVHGHAGSASSGWAVDPRPSSAIGTCRKLPSRRSKATSACWRCAMLSGFPPTAAVSRPGWETARRCCANGVAPTICCWWTPTRRRASRLRSRPRRSTTIAATRWPKAGRWRSISTRPMPAGICLMRRSFDGRVLALEEPRMSNRIAFAWQPGGVVADPREELARLPRAARWQLAARFLRLARARRDWQPHER